MFFCVSFPSETMTVQSNSIAAVIDSDSIILLLRYHELYRVITLQIRLIFFKYIKKEG